MATLVSTLPQPAQTPLPPNTAPYQLSQAASDLLGSTASGAANSLYADTNVTPAAARTAVNDLFSASGTAAEDQAQSQAQGIIASGDQQEAQAYLTAAGVADNNARLARASGLIQQYQEGRQVEKAIGAQTADINAAGFASANHTGAGTALFLQRDSVQQGALESQLIGENAEIQAGGFEQQSAAAKAEAAAAQTAGNAASTLAGAASAAGTSLTTNALNNAMSLLNSPTLDANGNPVSPTTGVARLTSLAAAGSIGRTGGGLDPAAFVTSGSPGQMPSPFTSGGDVTHGGIVAHEIWGTPMQPVNLKVSGKVDNSAFTPPGGGA